MASVSAVAIPEYQEIKGINRKRNSKNHPGSIMQKVNNINPSLVMAKTVAVGSATAAGFNVGRKGGTKFANWIEKNVVDFTKDFMKEEGGKVGFKKAVEKLPKIMKNSISWGVGGAAALLTALFAFKDSDCDGQFDIVEAVKKFFQPQDNNQLEEANA